MWTCKAEGLFVDLRGPFVSLIGPFVFLKVSSFGLRKFCIGLKGPNVGLREPSYVTPCKWAPLSTKEGFLLVWDALCCSKRVFLRSTF